MTEGRNPTPSTGLFLPYQSEMMAAVMKYPVVVVEKSRRTGMSWAGSFIADLIAGLSPEAGGMDVFYMGYNLEMAREFIDYCADHAGQMQVVAGQVQESFFRDPDAPEKDVKVFRIDFAAGHKVLALPSMARALRGMQGLVIIDEAAFHDDLAGLMTAALALLMWGGKVLIISTHNGDSNPFNILVDDVRAGRKPYHLLRTTFDDALEQGLYRKICAKTGVTWSEAAQSAWRDEIMAFYGSGADEELFCIPSPSTGAYIPLPLIEARASADIPVIRWAQTAEFSLWPEAQRARETASFISEKINTTLETLDRERPYVFGEDFGRSGDLTVIWVLSIAPDMRRETALVVELRNVPFDEQRRILFAILDGLPRWRAGKMDARGNGQYLAEVTVQRYGSRVEAVMLSEGWYREQMPPLKAAMEDAALTLPQDREIIDDIRLLQVVRGVARVPDQRRGGKTTQRHGDAAVALAMAYAASRADVTEYAYTSQPRAWGTELSGPPVTWPIERELAEERSGATQHRWRLEL